MGRASGVSFVSYVHSLSAPPNGPEASEAEPMLISDDCKESSASASAMSVGGDTKIHTKLSSSDSGSDGDGGADPEGVDEMGDESPLPEYPLSDDPAQYYKAPPSSSSEDSAYNSFTTRETEGNSWS